MRIINGKFKGRKILAPKNLPTRPTTDMAKESLFNILNNNYYFEDIAVLDLFSGTGNIAYEFASRGTTDITAIDQNPNCVQFINSMKDILDLTGFEVFKIEVLTYLNSNAKKYNVIYADPPYDFEHYLEIVTLVFKRELLLDNGVLIVEHDAKKSFKDHPKFVKHKKYGHVNLSFFEN